jgi:hypothetical protein
LHHHIPRDHHLARNRTNSTSNKDIGRFALPEAGRPLATVKNWKPPEDGWCTRTAEKDCSSIFVELLL